MVVLDILLLYSSPSDVQAINKSNDTQMNGNENLNESYDQSSLPSIANNVDFPNQ